MEEIWKDIKGFEGLYKISSLGNVKSSDRLKKNRFGSYYFNGRIMRTQINHKGYEVVSLSKDGSTKQFFVHRLVAQAFIDNPNNLPQVNHKNEIKTDNNVGNLEWCDNKYNSNYGTRNERMSKNQPKTKYNLRIPICQFSKDGKLIKVWSSVTEIEEELGFHASNITSCCKHKPHYLTAHGYVWRYASDVA